MSRSVARFRLAVAVGVLAGTVACSAANAVGDRDPLPSAGQRLSADENATVDREVCVDEWPEANTIQDARRILVLAERCWHQTSETEKKLAAAMDEAVSNEATGGAGGASDDAVDVQGAVAKLREAREQLAKATRGMNAADRRLDLIDYNLYQARLWQLGLGVQLGAAAAAGDRTFQRVGGLLVTRMTSSMELDFAVTAERVSGLDPEQGWRSSGKAIALFGRGGVAFAVGAGSGLSAAHQGQRPLIALLGLDFRPFPHLGCSDALPLMDLGIFAEYWHLDGDALATRPPDPPVFIGVNATFGFAFLRGGNEKHLALDQHAQPCVSK